MDDLLVHGVVDKIRRVGARLEHHAASCAVRGGQHIALGNERASAETAITEDDLSDRWKPGLELATLDGGRCDRDVVGRRRGVLCGAATTSHHTRDETEPRT